MFCLWTAFALEASAHSALFGQRALRQEQFMLAATSHHTLAQGLAQGPPIAIVPAFGLAAGVQIQQQLRQPCTRLLAFMCRNP